MRTWQGGRHKGTVLEEQAKNSVWAVERGMAGRVVSGEAGTVPGARCVLSDVAAAAMKEPYSPGSSVLLGETQHSQTSVEMYAGGNVGGPPVVINKDDVQ